jgi:hypothetical protein
MKILKENLKYPHKALCVVRHLLVGSPPGSCYSIFSYMCNVW